MKPLHRRAAYLLLGFLVLCVGAFAQAEGPANAPEEGSAIAEAAAAVTAGVETADERISREEFLDGLDEAVRFSRAGDRPEAAAGYLALVAGGYSAEVPLYNLGVLAEHDEKGARYEGDDLSHAPVFYEAALKENPGFFAARLNLGAYYHVKGLTEDAALEYRKLLGTGAPEEDPARYNLSLLLYGQGRTDEAIAMLEGAAEPYADPRRLMLLAYLNEKAGAFGRAIKLWKRAAAEEPEGPFAALAMRHLREIRGY